MGVSPRCVQRARSVGCMPATGRLRRLHAAAHNSLFPHASHHALQSRNHQGSLPSGYECVALRKTNVREAAHDVQHPVCSLPPPPCASSLRLPLSTRRADHFKLLGDLGKLAVIHLDPASVRCAIFLDDNSLSVFSTLDVVSAISSACAAPCRAGLLEPSTLLTTSSDMHCVKDICGCLSLCLSTRAAVCQGSPQPFSPSRLAITAPLRLSLSSSSVPLCRPPTSLTFGVKTRTVLTSFH